MTDNTINTAVNNEPAASTWSNWLADPMGSVIAATCSVMASFTLVVSGIGMIHMTLQ